MFDFSKIFTKGVEVAVPGVLDYFAGRILNPQQRANEEQMAQLAQRQVDLAQQQMDAANRVNAINEQQFYPAVNSMISAIPAQFDPRRAAAQANSQFQQGLAQQGRAASRAGVDPNRMLANPAYATNLAAGEAQAMNNAWTNAMNSQMSAYAQMVPLLKRSMPVGYEGAQNANANAIAALGTTSGRPFSLFSDMAADDRAQQIRDDAYNKAVALFAQKAIAQPTRPQVVATAPKVTYIPTAIPQQADYSLYPHQTSSVFQQN